MVVIASAYALAIIAAFIYGFYMTGTSFVPFLFGRGQLFSWIFWAFLTGGVLTILFAWDEYKRYAQKIPLDAWSFFIRASALFIFNAFILTVAYFVAHVNWSDF